MVIAIDFDGTIVEHEFPRIGKPIPLAVDVMKAWQRKGRKLILWTMRSGEYLQEALDYCKEQGVEFWGVNENPEQHTWATSKKAYAHAYIDDLSIGVPKKDGVLDWSAISMIVHHLTK